MALRPSTRRRIEALLAEHGKAIQEAFIAAIDDIRSKAEIGRIVAALEAGDIGAAIRAIHIEPAAYRTLERAIVAAYIAGGQDMVTSLPALRDFSGSRVGLRFDPGDARAARFISDHAAMFVTGIVAEQERALRAVLAEGMAQGAGPRSLVTQIVGRINRATGKREGGILGLTGNQAEFVSTARRELLSGDADMLRNYLDRQARDRRFDRTIKAAISNGTAVPAKTVGQAIQRYESRLEALRAEVIGRTEGLTAVSSGRHEATQQATEAAAIEDQLIERTWRATLDGRTRDTHAAMSGQTVVGVDTPFVSPSGASIMYPGDPDAPAEEIIACRCTVTVAIRQAE